MKTFLVVASLSASAFAQLASIISQTNGSTITAGSQLIVDVHQAVRTTLCVLIPNRVLTSS